MANKIVWPVIDGQSPIWAPGDALVDPDGNPLGGGVQPDTLPQSYHVVASEYLATNTFVFVGPGAGAYSPQLPVKKVGVGSVITLAPNLSRPRAHPYDGTIPGIVTFQPGDENVLLHGGVISLCHSSLAWFIEHLSIRYTGAAWEMRIFGVLLWKWNQNAVDGAATFSTNSGLSGNVTFPAAGSGVVGYTGHLATVVEGPLVQVGNATATRSGIGTAGSSLYARLYQAGGLVIADLQPTAAVAAFTYGHVGHYNYVRLNAAA